jgi:hypothetical protein
MPAAMGTGPVNTAALGVGDKVAISLNLHAEATALLQLASTSAQSGDKAKAAQKTAQNSTDRKIRSPKPW